jgi:hypothetical protein
MAKIKKGKAHHWYKEDKVKAVKKPYVPTGKLNSLSLLSALFV